MQRSVLNTVVWPYLARLRPGPGSIPKNHQPYSESLSTSTPISRPNYEPSPSSQATSDLSINNPWNDQVYISASSSSSPPTPHHLADLSGELPRFYRGKAQVSAREFLGLQPPEGRSAYAESSAMALKRIIQIHELTTGDDDVQKPSEKQAAAPKPPSRRAREKARAIEHIHQKQQQQQQQHQQQLQTSFDSQGLPDINPDLTSTLTITPKPTGDTASNSSLSLEHQKQTNSRPMILPPAIDRMLKARLYRLVVYNVLQTPEHFTDHTLVMEVVRRIEDGGAGKLASRLRRSIERSTLSVRSSAGSGGGGEFEAQVEGVASNIRLAPGSRAGPGKPRRRDENEDDDGDGVDRLCSRLPPDHWKIPPVPPLSTSTINEPSHQQRLNKFYNTQLTYLISHPAHPSHHSALSPNSLQISNLNRTPGRLRTPSPNAGLYQLRHLLHLIDRLEKHRGFKPDHVTSNIVIGCWLRCIAGIGHGADLGNRWRWLQEKVDHEGKGRFFKAATGGGGGRTGGGTHVGWKKYSEIEFGKNEVRALFLILSRVMSKSVQSTIDSYQTAATTSSNVSSSLSSSSPQPSSMSSSSPSSTSLPSSPTKLDVNTASPSTPSTSPPRPRGTDVPPSPSVSNVHQPERSSPPGSNLDYDRHLKPFCHLVRKAMKAKDDREGFATVIAWQKEMEAKFRALEESRLKG